MAGQDVHESVGQVQPAPASPDDEAEKAIVDATIEFFAFVKSYEQTQRAAEDMESTFEGEDMWDAEARAAREEHTDRTTGGLIPGKPTLSVNLLDQNIQQVVSEARQARLALTVRPRAGLANTTITGYFKGQIRSIQVESGALGVRLWALERACKVGRGAYLIQADFANDGDFDIDLTLERILDQGTVYFDPYAQRADRADMEECLITDWISEKDRIRRWKDKPLLPPAGAFDADDGDWFSTDEGTRRVRIATHYKVLHTERTLAFHPQFGKGWLDGEPTTQVPVMPPELVTEVQTKAPGTRTRPVDHRAVMIYIVDGTQVLEQRPWLGRYIPVIAVPGKEYFLKGKRRWKGIIANAMDVSRAINVLISAATELAGAMPRSPYIMYAGQDEGFETEWDELSTTNRSRIHVNATEVDGKPAPLPQRQQTEPQIQGLMLLLKMMQELFYSVTGSVAAQSRAVNPYDRSGKAIEALQRQGSAGTSNFLDNLATISMPYEGKVLVNAIPAYYDRPGRILRVMGEENDDDTAIMIKVPFTRDGNGNPVPVPCPVCQGTGEVRDPYAKAPCGACGGTGQATRETMPEQWQGKTVEYVDFADGEFSVQPVIDRNYQTKQDEALAGMTQLASAAPNLVPAYAATWVRAMGFSGANLVADAIDAAFPAPGKEFGDEKVPPQFVAQFKQLQQQHQQAMQALQEAQKLLETDAIKTAGQKEIAAIRAGLQEKIERLKVEGRMIEASTGHQADRALEAMRGQIGMLQQEMQQRHEILLALLKEQGAKEVERHSVELHDAAAAAAAERAELSAVGADVRKFVTAQEADARAEGAAARGDTRAEDAAVRAATRDAALTREKE